MKKAEKEVRELFDMSREDNIALHNKLCKLDQLAEKLKEIFDEMSLEDKIAIHNEYCKRNYYAEIIVPMDEFDIMNENMFAGLSASDIVYKVQRDFDKFELNDNYYYWTDNDDIISFSGEAGFEDVFFRGDVINYIISNQDSLGNYEIAECISN